MKYLFFLIPFLSGNLKGQSTLSFDHRFMESENKWVAIRTDKDTVMNFGFIYMDGSAGLTLNYQGSFTISKDGKFIPKPFEKALMKYRLKPNNVRVAFIPSTKFSELGITEYPDWLKFYRGDTSSITHLYRWGFLYNGYNECAKALTYLERAQKINPKFKGLAVELAFSYNCLSQFDKAIAVLRDVLAEHPTDAYVYKELILAQAKSGNLDKASENCKKAIAVCTDKAYNGEMCYNLLHEYYVRKDKINFNLWLDEAKKWISSNPEFLASVKAMEQELAK